MTGTTAADERATAATVVALLSDTSGSLHPGSRVASRNIEALFRAAGLAIGPRTAFMRPPDAATRAAIAAEARAVVVHGEGGLHHAAMRPKVAALLRGAVAAKRASGRPLVLVNAVVDTLDAEAMDLLAAFDALYVRDSRSAAELAAAGLRATWLPDLSLAAPCPVPPAPARRGVLVLDSVREDVRGAIRRAGAPVVSMDPRDIAGPLYRVRKFGPVDRFLRARSAPEATLRRIAAAEAVVTGRFHGMMFCLLTRTPFVAVGSNTHKMASALHDAFGDTGRLVPPSVFEAPLAAAVPPFTAAELAGLDAYLARCRTEAPAMAAAIAAAARA